MDRPSLALSLTSGLLCLGLILLSQELVRRAEHLMPQWQASYHPSTLGVTEGQRAPNAVTAESRLAAGPTIPDGQALGRLAAPGVLVSGTTSSTEAESLLDVDVDGATAAITFTKKVRSELLAELKALNDRMERLDPGRQAELTGELRRDLDRYRGLMHAEFQSMMQEIQQALDRARSDQELFAGLMNVLAVLFGGISAITGILAVPTLRRILFPRRSVLAGV